MKFYVVKNRETNLFWNGSKTGFKKNVKFWSHFGYLILALRQLDIIGNTLDDLRKYFGEKCDILTIDLDNCEIYINDFYWGIYRKLKYNNQLVLQHSIRKRDNTKLGICEICQRITQLRDLFADVTNNRVVCKKCIEV